MTKDEIIAMAREMATRHGVRMCDEDGETHGEELYCVDVDDIVEIIKEVAALVEAATLERAAKVCDEYAKNSSNPMNFAENCAVTIRALIRKDALARLSGLSEELGGY